MNPRTINTVKSSLEEEFEIEISDAFDKILDRLSLYGHLYLAYDMSAGEFKERIIDALVNLCANPKYFYDCSSGSVLPYYETIKLLAIIVEACGKYPNADIYRENREQFSNKIPKENVVKYAKEALEKYEKLS